MNVSNNYKNNRNFKVQTDTSFLIFQTVIQLINIPLLES